MKIFKLLLILLVAGTIASFFYEKETPKAEAQYIRKVDWPPSLQILDSSFSCLEAGEEIARAGKTELRGVGKREYCRTTILEGAAGSTYGQYAYALSLGSRTAIFSFSLQYVQCLNYDDPKQSECLIERENFDPDILIDEYVETINWDAI